MKRFQIDELITSCRPFAFPLRTTSIYRQFTRFLSLFATVHDRRYDNGQDNQNQNDAQYNRHDLDRSQDVFGDVNGNGALIAR